MPLKTLLPFAAFLGPMVLFACAVPSMPEAPEGAALFAENCVACHGGSGTGDGPAASGFVQKPADLTQISARYDGAFPTAQVLSQIDGYARQGHAGRAMPEFGEALGGDLVPIDVDGVATPTPRALAALLEYLQSIQQL
ncbi:MAG: cytochrome c [Sulfitobacter sp.]